MSNYDDPRWYEQPANQQQPIPHAPQPGQPGPAPAYDDFDHFPFLPVLDQQVAPQQQAALPLEQPDSPSRLQKVLGQALVLVALVVIAFWGGWFSHEHFGNTLGQSGDSQKYSQLIQEAWQKIDQNYVDRKAVDYKKLAYSAIDAMTQTLGDPGHSRFMDPNTVQNENQQLSGKFTGIGIYLHQDKDTKQLTITSTIPGSPAEKVFKSGDAILKINGVDMAGKDVTAASSLIQGKAGTTVTITIQRMGQDKPEDIKVARAEIQVPNVIMHYIPESHIAHIQIIQFAEGVSAQLRDAVTKAKGMGATRIILDLRNNPGGYLNDAINTGSLFIKSGNVLLEQDSSGQRMPIAVSGNPLDTTSQIVVLVNGNSASAAEIVAGALKDNGRATIIGTKTFGTGTVLQQFTLSDGSALFLGTQEWLTPKGTFIRQDPKVPNSGGILPDIKQDQPANAPITSPNEEEQGHLSQQQILDSGDTQLSAAIQYLLKH